MDAQVAASAELFRQLAFISALIGGFALTFLVQLLTTDTQRRIVSWTIGFALAASAGLIVCALGWTLGAAYLANPAAQAEMARLSTLLTDLHKHLSTTFVGSLLLFLVSLGTCGWVRSKTMGIVSTLIASIAAIASVLILRMFIR